MFIVAWTAPVIKGECKVLINGKSEEIAKYSKVNYVPEKFIKMCKSVWEYSDLQIRCIYLISDLAKKGKGVFSIAYSTFKDMFQQRFKMEISLSTVRRFFALMEKLCLLSKHEAKRKNEQQSANIYIIEKQSEEIKEEHPDELPSEHQNTSKEVDVKQKPLTNDISVVNKEVITNEKNQIEESINKLTTEYRLKGMSKALAMRVVGEVMQNIHNIKNFGGYLRNCLENAWYKAQVKLGHIDPAEKLRNAMENSDMPWFDWLNE